jgi:hypothetical protein
MDRKRKSVILSVAPHACKVSADSTDVRFGAKRGLAGHMSWPSMVEDSSIVSPTAVEDAAWLEDEPQLSWLIQNMDDQPLLVNSGNPLTQKDIAITTRSQLNACSMT